VTFLCGTQDGGDNLFIFKMLFTLGSCKNVIDTLISGEIFREKAKYIYKMILKKYDFRAMLQTHGRIDEVIPHKLNIRTEAQQFHQQF
jgi:hypothetical protein